jgi:sugar lactone lactonase YvrE
MNTIICIFRYLKVAPKKRIWFTKNTYCQSTGTYTDVDPQWNHVQSTVIHSTISNSVIHSESTHNLFIVSNSAIQSESTHSL